MGNYIKEIVFIGIVLLFSTGWLLVEKNHAVRKYILAFGLFLIAAPVAYIAGKLLDLPALFGLILVAIAGAIIFYAKAVVLRRRLEKSNNYSNKH